MQPEEQQQASNDGGAARPPSPATGAASGQTPGQEGAVKKKTSSGLEENVAGLLCYVLGWVTGIIFLIVEKESRFVRYHALQSIIVFGALTVLNWVLSYIPFIGWLFNLLFVPVSFILWILLMIKAYQGQYYKLPYVGDIAEKQADSLKAQ